MRKKNKKPPLTFFRDRITILVLLSLVLTFLTASPRLSTDTLVTDISIQKPDFLKVSPSILGSQVQADSNHEDYCLTVPVILYHHIQPLYLSSEKQQDALSVGVEYFDMHMNYLASNSYISLSADKLVTALLNHEELPPKSVIVTIDDGYEDNYLYAYPILKKYGIIGNFMIPTGLIGKKDYMSWSQLHEMASNPLVRLYNHTTNHVDVGNAPYAVAEQEIKQAQDTLLEQTGFNYPIFTYPYGTVSESTKKALRSLGFAGAYTTQPGFTQCRSTILELHRDHVGNLPLSSYGL